MAKQKPNPEDYPKATRDPNVEVRLVNGEEVHWNKAEGGPVCHDPEFEQRQREEAKAEKAEAKAKADEKANSKADAKTDSKDSG
jgi:trimethylamine:corrinoid methyltransferase-like protein